MLIRVEIDLLRDGVSIPVSRNRIFIWCLNPQNLLLLNDNKYNQRFSLEIISLPKDNTSWDVY